MCEPWTRRWALLKSECTKKRFSETFLAERKLYHELCCPLKSALPPWAKER